MYLVDLKILTNVQFACLFSDTGGYHKSTFNGRYFSTSIPLTTVFLNEMSQALSKDDKGTSAPTGFFAAFGRVFLGAEADSKGAIPKIIVRSLVTD